MDPEANRAAEGLLLLLSTHRVNNTAEPNLTEYQRSVQLIGVVGVLL